MMDLFPAVGMRALTIANRFTKSHVLPSAKPLTLYRPYAQSGHSVQC